MGPPVYEPLQQLLGQLWWSHFVHGKEPLNLGDLEASEVCFKNKNKKTLVLFPFTPYILEIL